MEHKTWIRVEDNFGQYDHEKGLPLPDRVRVVEGYPEHVGPWAREGKPRTNKAAQPSSRPVAGPAK